MTRGVQIGDKSEALAGSAAQQGELSAAAKQRRAAEFEVLASAAEQRGELAEAAELRREALELRDPDPTIPATKKSLDELERLLVRARESRSGQPITDGKLIRARQTVLRLETSRVKRLCEDGLNCKD